MDLCKWNSIKTSPTLKKFTDLAVGSEVRLKKLERVTTRYGESVTVLGTKGEEQHYMYLPKRYNSVITDEEINKFEEDTIAVKYMGIEDRTIILEFIKLK
uniref:Uncharacterized protein n=1 Tax=Clastoptera arizonana TaxID=38151 RepID=A0A1B6DMB8_9HEMI